MNTYQLMRFTLALGLALVIGVIPLTANAEDARLRVNHQVLKQATAMEHGQLLVEVINSGVTAINSTAISLDNASNLQLLPSRLQLGQLEPGKVKAVNVAFQRSSSPDAADTGKALLWQVEYRDVKGLPQQLRVLGGSQDMTPPVTDK